MQRPSVSEMPMEARLNKAIENRIIRENDFIKEIIAEINSIISSLDQYDPSNARTDIDLTQDQLREIVFKLNDYNNINLEKATSVANIVRDSHLLRSPQSLQSVQPPPLMTQSALPMTPSAVTPPPAPATSLRNTANPGETPSNGINAANTRPGNRPRPGFGGRRTRKRKGKY